MFTLEVYETWTLLGLGVSWCRTCVGVRHRHDTYYYTELCYFQKLLSVSCPVFVSVFHSLRSIYTTNKAKQPNYFMVNWNKISRIRTKPKIPNNPKL